MPKLLDFTSHTVNLVLDCLLKDRTTGKNIIFATDMYDGFDFSAEITKDLILSGAVDFRPRVLKHSETQAMRTRTKAEVFTPSWICNVMNNHCDAEWFGRDNVFNTEQNAGDRHDNPRDDSPENHRGDSPENHRDDRPDHHHDSSPENHRSDRHSWTPTEGKILFPKDKTWEEYVDSRRLEITCGEAPFLVSRYDTVTGEEIPIERRIGMLDRKLRIINENTETHKTWLKYVYRAFESVYGYEYQGDNLLIARVNLLETFCEYTRARWNMEPDETSLNRIADIISRNIWQMDGLYGIVPMAGCSIRDEVEKKEKVDSDPRSSLLDLLGDAGKTTNPGRQESASLITPTAPTSKPSVIYCKIKDWCGKKTVLYNSQCVYRFVPQK